MNVSCPECRSVFRVDPSKVPATGVRARCSVCGGIITVGAGGSIDEEFGAAQPATQPEKVRSAAPVAAPAEPVRDVFAPDAFAATDTRSAAEANVPEAPESAPVATHPITDAITREVTAEEQASDAAEATASEPTPAEQSAVAVAVDVRPVEAPAFDEPVAEAPTIEAPIEAIAAEAPAVEPAAFAAPPAETPPVATTTEPTPVAPAPVVAPPRPAPPVFARSLTPPASVQPPLRRAPIGPASAPSSAPRPPLSPRPSGTGPIAAIRSSAASPPPPSMPPRPAMAPPSSVARPAFTPPPPTPQPQSPLPLAQTSTATSTPSTVRTPINPFLANDPNAKARRLSRALISDLVTYFPQRREEGLRDGTLRELFQEEIKKSHEEYIDQVGREFAESTTHFQDALNEILAAGRKMF